MQPLRSENRSAKAPSQEGSKDAAKLAPVTPSPIIETTFAFAQSCALLAAVELNVCTWIARGMETSAQIAEHAKVAEPALLRLLDTLCAMGFLQCKEHKYVLTPVSERFLVRDRDTYIGDVALQIRHEWDAWIDLTKAIQTGRSIRTIDKEPLGGPFFAQMVEYLFPIVYPVMRRLCQRLEVNTYENLQVADLGSGNAPSAIAVLEQNSKAHAVAIDFPEVLEKAREYAQQRGVDTRMEYWAEDLRTVSLPVTHFGLIFASHTFRVVGEEVSRRLIVQAYQALKPGGRLIIVESYNNPSHPEKLFPHIISLNMLVNTSTGDAFSLSQVEDWVSKAGFQVEVWQNIAPDPVVVAIRP